MSDSEIRAMASQVFVRLRPELATALDAAASEAGLSRAGWARREIARSLPDASEVASLPLSPPRRPTTIPPADLAEVSRLSASLSRTGGAVVQLTKAFRHVDHPLHADAEAVLSELRAVQVVLVSVINGLRHRQTS